MRGNHPRYKVQLTIQENSVQVYRRTSMKLQSVSLIVIFGVVGFAEMVKSLCLIRNTVEPKIYWYQCSMSHNYLSDVEAAPVDVPIVSFSHSKMQVLQNRSFARLSSDLDTLQIHYSEIGEIEDNAFEGLDNLNTLEIVGCNLKIVKGAWFKGLTSLKKVFLQRNAIEFIENSFFSTVPPLNTLDISENKLNCLLVDSLADFHTVEFRVADNPLFLMCLAPLMDWLTDKNIYHDYTGRNNMGLPLEVLNDCRKKLPTLQLDEEFLNNCTEKTLKDYLLPQENYTIEELCQSLKDKPSPYFDCSI